MGNDILRELSEEGMRRGWEKWLRGDMDGGPRPTMEEYQNISGIVDGRVSGQFSEWPALRPEMERALNEIKASRARIAELEATLANGCMSYDLEGNVTDRCPFQSDIDRLKAENTHLRTRLKAALDVVQGQKAEIQRKDEALKRLVTEIQWSGVPNETAPPEAREQAKILLEQAVEEAKAALGGVA